MWLYVIAFACLLIYLIHKQNDGGSSVQKQKGGGYEPPYIPDMGPPEEESEEEQEEMPELEPEPEPEAKTECKLIKHEAKLNKCAKSLETINRKLDVSDELTAEEHQEVRKIAVKTGKLAKKVQHTTKEIQQKKSAVLEKVRDTADDEELAQQLATETEEETGAVLSIQNHIGLTKSVLGNHHDRLKQLEQYLCKITSGTNKNNALLADIKNKLQTSVTKKSISLESGLGASIKSEEEQDDQKLQVEETTNKIRDNCPVCPINTGSNNPVDIKEVTNQGYGTIAPVMGPFIT
jgi:hypothetical protein